MHSNQDQGARHRAPVRGEGRRAPSVVRGRVQGIVLAVLIGGLVSPLVARAAAPAPHDPLRYVRLVHRLQLRAHGAHITGGPVTALQQAHNDCAPTIVAELYRSAGRAAPASSLLDTLLAVGPRGVTLDRLAGGLTALGWSAVVRRVLPSPGGTSRLDLRHLRAPAIALLRPGHFVLLVRQDVSHVEYFDPLIGQVRQPLPQFVARWTGKGVQLSTRDN